MVPEHADPLDSPVLNSPYEPTAWHWTIDQSNRAMRPALQGRRDSIAMLPVPATPTEGTEQQALQLTDDDKNDTVNRIRASVRRWREAHYPGTTLVTRKLLEHWRREDNEPRLFFAQVEALETLIWLTEVAKPDNELRRTIEAASAEHNDRLIRYATKMATGTGKTVVMGMVIAWHAVNAAHQPNFSRRDGRRYHTRFLAITPGHTVRERLAVLDPAAQPNVYDDMRLVPAGMRPLLNRVQVRIVNFQAFQRRDLLPDATGDARKLLRRGSGAPERERTSVMLARVLRGLYDSGVGGGRSRAGRSQQICVINDEAHHCYLPEEHKTSGEDAEQRKTAALWFSALRALADDDRLGAVYDFSATPMFIRTAARKRTIMFPWVVSDFPLMDAIEAGLVKIPRVPVADDSAGPELEWRNLYHSTHPKTIRRDNVPPTLEAALDALYRDYAATHEAWQETQMPTPPVFIVVASTIDRAEAMFQYLAGWSETVRSVKSGGESQVLHHEGGRELFNNYVQGEAGEWLPGPVRTLLVHSKIEGDDKLGGRVGAAMKLQADRLRAQGAVGDDSEVMREALNSVGTEGGLGEQIRCVVSVSMLTEGWDTRTVTHILGFRAFGTQLLCEQVTGRALRRSLYDSFDESGHLRPEFANVLGVPYDFMPTGEVIPPPPPKPRYRVHTVEGRRPFRIEFPMLTGYGFRPESWRTKFDADRVQPFVLKPEGTSASELAGIAGPSETIATPTPASRRQQAEVVLAEAVTRRLEQMLADVPEEADAPVRRGVFPRRLALFRDSLRAVRQWLDHDAVDCGPDDAHIGWLAAQSAQRARAAQAVADACLPNAERVAQQVIGFFSDQVDRHLGDTSQVDFETSLSDRYPAQTDARTVRSELNLAACHSNLESRTAALLDELDHVDAWARNFQLDWTVPYQFEGVWRHYVPDFVARLFGGIDHPHAVYLMIECKGVPDEVSQAKHQQVQNMWIPAVRNSPQVPARLKSWDFVEVTMDSDLSLQLQHAVRWARRLLPTGSAAAAA